jgi:ATP-dependent Lhr-like helicase
MTSAFDRLSPALQYQIVNGLGFSGLRPVQDASAQAILDGNNCVVLAPTAGGKTEAAFFPLLSQMDTEDWRPVSVIYIAPIRALLNNQEGRLARYAELVGRRAFKWHGDVNASTRRGFINAPADVLLTTPESLEVMLMSKRVPAERLFRGLRAVVIDEIHAFVGTDRGGHLSALLERLSRFCGKDVQRIGLSATVGNPDAILRWLAGSSRRAGQIVDPGGSRKEPEIKIDWVANLQNAARMVAQLHPGKKRLVFVDSRRGVEAMGQALRDLGVDAYVTHSSLSLEERQLAETAFQEGKDCVIVATSALELGIDIGDLDHVLQVDAPSTVAAFMQRMGRTGRREGKAPNCTFLAVEEEGLLRAAAIVQLFRQGYVEPVSVPTRAAHLLAHQLMALSIQCEGGVPVSDWWAWVSSATPFQGLTQADRDELVAHLLAQDILVENAGRYCLGERGEKRYGWRNFSELYAVFSAPQTLKVLWGASEIGSIDVLFAQQERVENLSFVLGAKAWRAVAVDFSEGVVRVEPMSSSALPRWQGRADLLSQALCQAMRSILASAEMSGDWSQRAQAKLAELRATHNVSVGSKCDPVADEYGQRLWTFAGGKANNLLARTLEGILGEKITVDNLYIGFRGTAAASDVAIRQAIDQLRREYRPNHDDALRFAKECGRGRLSKFQPCLSERLEMEYLAEVLTNEVDARAVLSENADTDGLERTIKTCERCVGQPRDRR